MTYDSLTDILSVYNEIYKKVLLGSDDTTATQVIGIMQQARVIYVTTAIAIKAAKFSFENKLPMVDSLIYITGRMHNSIIWTQDIYF